MSLSLNELEALCRKAARGAGLDWGMAEEAGRAVRRLVAFGLPGAEVLLARLERRDGRADVASALSPCAPGAQEAWRGAGGDLCPIFVGAAFSDSAWRLGPGGALTVHGVLSPLLIVPLAGLATRRLGGAVRVAWDGAALVDDGRLPRLEGSPSALLAERADTVHCSLEIAAGGSAGETLVPITRARPAPGAVERLEAFASRTYAPATEASRLRGAGGTGSEDG